MALGSTQSLNRNEYQEYFLGCKGGRCVRLTTLPPSCADCLEIWEPQPSGTLTDWFTFYRHGAPFLRLNWILRHPEERVLTSYQLPDLLDLRFLCWWCRRSPLRPYRLLNIARYMSIIIAIRGRSQWPRGLKRRSAAFCFLGFRVRIPPGAWMSVSYECCVLSGRGLCVGLITRPKESYQLWCVSECDRETSIKMRSCPTRGCCAIGKSCHYNHRL
jgi:hypothetical protein